MNNQQIAQFYLSPRIEPRGNWTHYWQTMSSDRMKQLISELIASGELEDYTKRKLEKLPL